MGGVDKFPYPKATWSPAGGWWHETKNWRGKTGTALVVMTLTILPLALYSRGNHVKFPSEERRKLASHTRPEHPQRENELHAQERAHEDGEKSGLDHHLRTMEDEEKENNRK
ncbi:hypothetical protein FI667_g6660, partial [Globisporangium splendens]